MTRFLFLLLFVCSNFVNAQGDTLFYEGFDGGIRPNGWEIIDNDGYTVHPSVIDFADAWVFIADPFEQGNFVAGSTSFFQPVDRADRWLISPEIQLGSTGNVLQWFARSHDPSFPDSYRVMVATNAGTEVQDFQDTVAVIANEFPSGLTRKFSLNKFDGQSVRIAFVNQTFNGFKLYVDSILVMENDPLSVSEIEKSELQVKVYPNPTSQAFKINVDAEIQKVVLINLSGAVVEEWNGLQTIFDIQHLQEGMYLLDIQTDKGRIQRKILKH
jgi:hypothetical protein